MAGNKNLIGGMESRSKENFKASKVLLRLGSVYRNATASRLYFSAYQAVVKELESNKPELLEAYRKERPNVKHYPHEFVRKRLKDARVTANRDVDLYEDLFDLRIKADYASYPVEAHEVDNDLLDKLKGLIESLGVYPSGE